jgi:hypothetical protein
MAWGVMCESGHPQSWPKRPRITCRSYVGFATLSKQNPTRAPQCKPKAVSGTAVGRPRVLRYLTRKTVVAKLPYLSDTLTAQRGHVARRKPCRHCCGIKT